MLSFTAIIACPISSAPGIIAKEPDSGSSTGDAAVPIFPSASPLSSE
jgi:hypothetical protein